MEDLPCGDGWRHCISGNSLDVQRCCTDLSWVFCPQVTQKLPVSCSTGIVPVIPLGPAHCKEQ